MLFVCLALLAVGAVAPVAAAEPATFGNCWIEYTRVVVVDENGNSVYETDVPRGIACAW